MISNTEKRNDVWVRQTLPLDNLLNEVLLVLSMGKAGKITGSAKYLPDNPQIR